MRFLGITETCDLASLYRRLLAEGHEVRVAISDPLAQGTGAGLIPRTADWRGELDWIRQAGRDGVVLFESVSEGFGALQDRLRGEGLQVIGGSAFGDRLENDRAFGQAMLADLGFPPGDVREFDDAAQADAFIAAHPARYVFKRSGADHAADDTYVGRFADGRDVRAMIAARLAERTAARFILMPYIDGIEMGVGAYFDGDRFLRPACLDWEHKRFFAGDLGELTGEMGTVATYDRSDTFFARTLGLVEPRLRGHGHVGYVNLNTIVNADGIWPLEFTCRFGYPGFAVLEPLQACGWGDLFARLLSGQGGRFATRPGFSVGVVMTTPPFPYSRHQVAAAVGLPVMLDPDFTDRDLRHLHFGEMGSGPAGLVTSGLYGWTMVVTGTGPSIALAQRAAYERVRRVAIPDARYRLDIGDLLAAGHYDDVRALGLID